MVAKKNRYLLPLLIQDVILSQLYRFFYLGVMDENYRADSTQS